MKKAIKNSMKNYKDLYKDNCVIIDIVSGSIQVSIFTRYYIRKI